MADQAPDEFLDKLFGPDDGEDQYVSEYDGCYDLFIADALAWLDENENG
jgi:hypothetical protein